LPLNFDFSEEQELFRRTVREFAKKEIAPKIGEYAHKGEFPWELYRKMGKAGLLGLRFPKEYGGQEADAVTMGILVEEVARAGWQIPLGDIMGEILALHGPEHLKGEWLPAMTKGERLLGIANTEPSTGSDAAAITTRAIRRGGNYILNGENGFHYVMETFDLMRALIAIWCVGMAEGALDENIEYVKQRTAFGRPIAKYESVQSRIVEGCTTLEAARLLCYRTLWLKDKGEKITKHSAMTKWYAPQLCFGIVNDCLQNRGAIGFTTECLDEYRLREIRGAMIGDGTTDINKIVVARELLGREFLPYR